MIETKIDSDLSNRHSDYINLSLSELVLKGMREYWYLYLGAIISLIITHWTQSLLPFLASDLGKLANQGKLSEAPLLFYLELAIIILVFRTLSRWIFFYPARLLQRNFRLELLKTLENASPVRYKSYNPGQIFQMVQIDLDTVRAFIGFVLLQILNVIVALAILLPKLASFNVTLLWAFVPLFGSVALFIFILTRFQHHYRRIFDRQGEVNNQLIESYHGKATIKNYHAENSFLELFRNTTIDELSSFYKAGLGSAFGMPLITLGVGASFVWGAYLIQRDHLGASSLILFSGFIFLFKEPLSFLSWIGIIISNAKGAYARIQELVEHIQSPSPWEEQLSECPYSTAYDFYYLEVPFWGRPLALTVAWQKMTVIVAQTGHGKSTLLRTFSQMFKQQEVSFSLVEQVPYLYNDTIEKNLFLGKTATPQDKKNALYWMKVFMLDQLVSKIEDLLPLEVGEMGKRLSGGQAKRVCLIRSILSDASVLLWDDPFSSVDIAQEQTILKAIREHPDLKNKTFILSAHRLSTVKMCDEVILISKDEGILERGEVANIFEQASLIRDYFQKQLV